MAGTAEDQGPLVLGVVISMLTIGGIFIFARVISRAIIKPSFGFDDALIIITWFIILGYNTAYFVSTHRGYGKHINDLTIQQYRSAVHAEVIGQVFAICAFPTGKASIAWLLLRIFPGKELRWVLGAFVAANAVCFYLDAIFILVQCNPVAFQWNQSIKGGSCWKPEVVIAWGFVTGVTGAVTDFAFAILPWFYISKVKIGLKEKISVGIALSMGIFAGVCSILKIYYTSTLGAHTDYTYDTIPLVLWSSAELALINIAACIPTLRPLYLWLAGKDPQGQHSKASAYRLTDNTNNEPLKRMPHQDNQEVPLGSLADFDRNIYQTRSYDVDIDGREGTLSKSSDANAVMGPTVSVHYAC